MKNGKLVLAIIVIAGLVGLGLIIVGCTSSTSWLQAQAEYERAQAAKMQAASQGEVNIVGANTDAYIRKLETENRAYQERERFNQELAWQTYTDHLAEIQKFTIAMKTAEAIASSSQAAADNSYWNLLLSFGLGFVLLCVGGLSLYCYKEIDARLAKIETLAAPVEENNDK